MSDTTTKKRALIKRDFEDAGTGESFTKGDTLLIDAGAFGNYEAAGLVATPPAKKAPAKPKAKAAAKLEATRKQPSSAIPAPAKPLATSNAGAAQIAPSPTRSDDATHERVGTGQQPG
jgi:hypothetical protein